MGSHCTSRAGAKRQAALAAGVLVLLLATLLVRVPLGQAAILPAQTVDGPSQNIVGFGGVAMAEDGSGGLVYLKRVEGVTHVFVSRFVDGSWQAPIRVDSEEPYAASWARIGAAEGGELIVVWATPYATDSDGKLLYELMGALLGPGGTQFGQAVIVDGNIQEATGTSPDLAVSSSGQADVVYRVVEPKNTQIPKLHPGDVAEQVRLAHFDGKRWSNLGAINRDTGVSMRPPSVYNAPQIAIGPTGNGVVVWQEPEIEGVARIWARRIFGSSIDYVMPVSATTYGGTPIPDDADAPAVAFSRLGQAEVVYRQSAGPGSPLPGPRIFWNVLPDGESENGGAFKGAEVIDNDVPGGQAATVGPPSIDIDENRSLRVLYDDNGVPRVIEGDDKGLSGALTLGPDFAGSEPLAQSVMNPNGGGISAWPSADAQGHPAVAIREDFSEGGVQTGLVSGGAGGEVAELAVGRSGLGDGLVAFRQGQLGNAAIVATQVSAPPVAPLVNTPEGWIRPRQALVSWERAVTADPPVSYHVVLDGHVLPTPQGAMSMRLNPHGLASGVHRLQILAVDANGDSVLTAPAKLQIDGAPPSVGVRRARSGVSVTVTDRFSGVATKAIRISFGDGTSARGRSRFSHTYARPGLYRIVVYVRDRIGVSGVVYRWVRIG